MTQSFVLIGGELDRVKAARAEAEAELEKVLERAEQLHTYIGHLTEEIGELVADRGAVLSRRRKDSNTGSERPE